MKTLAEIAALVVCLSGAAGAHDHASPLSFKFGGPFSLVDHTGQRRTDKEFRGRFMLVYFGYANCRAMCPLGIRRMVAALDQLGSGAAQVQPILITVDPARDTVAALAAAVPRLHPKLIGLTGSAAELRAVAKAYNVHTKRSSEPGDKNPVYAHGTYIFLMKPDGGFATLVPPFLDAEGMAKIIRPYLSRG